MNVCMDCGARSLSGEAGVPHAADCHAGDLAVAVGYEDLGFCPCCGALFGCYCHEYPHWNRVECPGGNVVVMRPDLEHEAASGGNDER